MESLIKGLSSNYFCVSVGANPALKRTASSCRLPYSLELSKPFVWFEHGEFMIEEEKYTDDQPSEEQLDGSDEGEMPVESKINKISLEKNDRSLAELNRWFKSGKIIIDPEWQRNYVWDKTRAAKLIESFLIELPVPVIYLGQNSEEKYEVIDGLQRMTSTFMFFNNEFPLSGLEIRPELNGKHFRDLDIKTQGKLEDTTLRTFELANTTPKDLMFIIFERLNTGGKALNDMEIRNCMFRGELNDLIKELATNTEFVSSINQKNIDKRMHDRALVLRFLAFYSSTYLKAKKGLKPFLNEFLETYKNPPPAKLIEFKSAFTKSMRACYTIFGNKAFRLRKTSERDAGQWTPKINASVFQVLAVSFSDYDIGQLTRASDAIYEEYCDIISNDPRWVQAVSNRTSHYSNVEYAFETWRARLKEAVKGSEPNDTVRCFSRALKEELYAKGNTCSICSNKITSINDPAIDHNVHYWRGGKTVPENARLAHRQCNWERDKF